MSAPKCLIHRGGLDGRLCRQPALRKVTTGCVHEHIDTECWVCEDCAKEIAAGGIFCTLCGRAGHRCPALEIVRAAS